MEKLEERMKEVRKMSSILLAVFVVLILAVIFKDGIVRLLEENDFVFWGSLVAILFLAFGLPRIRKRLGCLFILREIAYAKLGPVLST